ncbi:meiosis regulator and mRNA stability factor 1 [Anopheles nili]|uniref:meiosis regulator and mRNA stability factor 1 n=1 Tax=Anopheles nili TaxID=185578 RepID=UPI00237B99B1|nr:meiosis regulator and mRNA stability factor 1 [Anopheles nili]
MNNSNTYFEMQPFPDVVANLAAEKAKMFNTKQPNNGLGGYNMKFYNYYQQSTPYVPQIYGNCFQKQRYTPYPSRNCTGTGVGPSNWGATANHSNLPQLLHPQSQQLQSSFQLGSNGNSQQMSSNKSLNSSLNSSSYSDSGKNSTFLSSHSGCSSPHQSTYSSDSASMTSSNSMINTSGGPGTCSSLFSSSVSPIPQAPASLPPTLNAGVRTTYISSVEQPEQKEMVVLQISNLDASIEEHKMHQFLMCQLKPITPVLALTIESPSLAKVKVPSAQCAKQVVANLHRKKIGHKRMVVSYIKDPSSAESSALRCQVAGLLKDVPFYSLPINRFRELFQSRFKSSISVLDLYRMQDVCTITLDKNDEKHISLQPALIDTLKNSSLVEASQHSVPYCMYHFKQEKEKGWAEQEVLPLPNVMMSINQLQSLVYSLLKSHKNDIPVASVLYCIESELQVKILPNDNGVPLEHLLCCIRGVQIANNSFGIKVLSWMDHEQNSTKDNEDAWSTNLRYMPKGPSNEFLQQISREVVELIKMSPKSTMKFTRFIPAYHNHFGKQCRVADYGYTRLIELFEALAPVVQVMGDGENRHITLTHRTQIRRFTNDLLKILRNRANKSILLSQLPTVFLHVQNRPFDVTDYGVCDLLDMVDGLVYSNTIMTQLHNENDVIMSIVKRKQTLSELEKTSVFAGEVVELFRKAPQFSILFKKFVRSYHYHFGYQCRLSDYGLLKLADLLEAISGIVEMEQTNDEDRKIFLNYQVAMRMFAEQVQDIIKTCTGKSSTMVRLSAILEIHKNQYGYQLQASCLGFSNIYDAIKALPFTEIFESGGEFMVISHLEEPSFRMRTYAACVVLIESRKDRLTVSELIRGYQQRFKEFLNEKQISVMKHALTIEMDKGTQTVTMTALMRFVVRIVQAVKQRAPINVYDLKMALNVSLGTCFELGYPNFLTVLNTFSDVFVANNSSFITEKSDIELNRDCILSKPWFANEDNPSQMSSSIGSSMANFKLPSVDPRYRMPANLSGAGALRNLGPVRNVTNNNISQQQQQLQSMRNDNTLSLVKVLQQQQQQQHYQPIHQTQTMQGMQNSLQYNQQIQSSIVPYYANNRTLNTGAPNSYGNGNGVNSSMLTLPLGMASTFGLQANGLDDAGDKENLFSTQNTYGIHEPMTASLSSKFASASSQGPSLDAFQNVPLLAASAPSQFHSSDMAASNPSTSSLLNWRAKDENITALSLHRNSILELLSKYSEPPKPDTPPPTNLPYWLDPTWTDSLPLPEDYSMCTDSGKSLNIPIPELKTFSNLPPLDTPNILLCDKLLRFTFDEDK